MPPVTERLIIFTRYPEPGKTKTRLIPALGANGAAALQQLMTEHTVRQVRSLDRLLSVEIRFTGGNSPTQTRQKHRLMQDWLGRSLTYEPQAQGDLGMRMAQAFQAAFTSGCDRVVTIGTDCPSLDATRLAQAFDALRTHDLVLGPATDGGYYLIGLKRLEPTLFQGIAWGTSEVFRKTVEAANQAGLSIAYLDPLTDIDRPEDLPVWEQIAAQTCPISVIVPVLNEVDRIAPLLSQLQPIPGLEILIVDGGSQDQTVEQAASLGARVIHSVPGRAWQMNAGAQAATGKILLFLHADTQLPDGFTTLIRQTLAQPNIVAGAFDLAIDANLPGLRLVEIGVRWRSRLCQLPYGDQAIFIKAETFDKVGGFPELPIMEDFELMQRLKRLGKVAIAPASVTTSGRRWRRLGVWRTTLINQITILSYLLGQSPDKLAAWYRQSSFKR
jgi:uncharacterized protein